VKGVTIDGPHNCPHGVTTRRLLVWERSDTNLSESLRDRDPGPAGLPGANLTCKSLCLEGKSPATGGLPLDRNLQGRGDLVKVPRGALTHEASRDLTAAVAAVCAVWRLEEWHLCCEAILNDQPVHRTAWMWTDFAGSPVMIASASMQVLFGLPTLHRRVSKIPKYTWGCVLLLRGDELSDGVIN
jgi:hypothetical protein